MIRLALFRGAFFLFVGWNPWSVTGFVHGDNVTSTADAVGLYLNDQTVNVVLRGAEGASDACFMQRILKKVEIPVPVEPDPSEESSVALSGVDLVCLGCVSPTTRLWL